jgi:hypothetical protein
MTKKRYLICFVNGNSSFELPSLKIFTHIKKFKFENLYLHPYNTGELAVKNKALIMLCGKS